MKMGKAWVAGTLGAGLSILAMQAAAQAQRPYVLAAPIGEPMALANEDPAGQAITARLVELGYVPGRRLVIEIRSTEGQRERTDAVAEEVVALRPDVIMVPTCGRMLDAVHRLTSTVPIVVATCNDDLVASGHVASLAHPGGNVTGLQKLAPELSAKRLELLRDFLPRATRVAVLWDPNYSSFDADWRFLREAARRAGITLQPVQASRPEELEAAFAAAVQGRAEAMLTLSDPMTFRHGQRVAQLAARHRLPLITPYREAAQSGGLASYGPNILAMVRRAAELVDQILKGARPADIPVEQAARFEMVVNARTAKALGLAVPAGLRVRADEVIE